MWIFASSHGIRSPLNQIFSVGVMGMTVESPRDQTRAASASPISGVEPDWADGSAQALRMRVAASPSPRKAGIMAAERTEAVGLALAWPGMSGAEPCTGSNNDGPVRAG